jgi:ribonuclease HI
LTLTAYTDGAARGNPGEGGIGVKILDESGATVHTHSEYIGTVTNNVAEYRALLHAVAFARKSGCSRLVVRSDSELMVRQLNGIYKVKDAKLARYVKEVRSLIQDASFTFEIVHIAREQNRDADELANAGIDDRDRSADR